MISWVRWLPKLIAGLVIVALCIALAIERRQNGKLSRQVGALQQARVNDAQRFKDAAIQAAKDQRANIARVAASQDSISREKASDYRAELVALRQRFTDRLRREADRADPGRAGSGDLPGISDAAERADVAAADIEFACRADALQLTALQDWIRAQAGVELSSNP